MSISTEIVPKTVVIKTFLTFGRNLCQNQDHGPDMDHFLGHNFLILSMISSFLAPTQSAHQDKGPST